MPVIPRLDPEAIHRHLEVLDRDPFRLELGRLLECAPTTKALKAFANKYPEKWAKALSTLGTLSGYETKTETQTNIYTQINVLSDSQLEEELKKTLRQLSGELIEHDR